MDNRFNPEGKTDDSSREDFDQGSYTGTEKIMPDYAYPAADSQELWICPNDETINTGEFCIVCGMAKNASSEAPKSPSKEIAHPFNPKTPIALGISFERDHLEAAIALGNTVQILGNLSGNKCFIIRNDLDFISALSRAIRAIISSAKAVCIGNIERISFAVPADVTCREISALVCAAHLNGISNCRFLYISEAQAVWLWHSFGDKKREHTFSVLSPRDNRIELAHFDSGDGILETISVSILGEDTIDLSSHPPISAYIAKKNYHPEAVKLVKDFKERMVNTHFYPCAYAPASGAAIITGNWLDIPAYQGFLLLTVIRHSWWFLLGNKRYFPAVKSCATLPVTIEKTFMPSDSPGGVLAVAEQDNNGIYAEIIRVPIAELEYPITIFMQIGADMNITVRITDRVGKSIKRDYFQSIWNESIHNTHSLDVKEEAAIRNLIEIADHVFYGILACEKAGDTRNLQGYQQLLAKIDYALSQYAVKPIRAVGSQFSPEYHCAVTHENSVYYENNTVIREYKRGYVQNGKILRYSAVGVAN